MNTKQKKRSFITSPGLAEPLGATVVEGGVNFAVFSTGATEGKLHVFKSAPDTDAEAVLPMHRSGSVYHLHVDGLDDGAHGSSASARALSGDDAARGPDA